MATIANLIVKLNADISNYKKNMEVAENKAKQFQSTMSKTTSSIGGLNPSFSSAGGSASTFSTKMTGLSSVLGTVSDAVKQVGSNMTKYLTLPIAAGGALSGKTFIQYESSLNQVNKNLGTSSNVVTDWAKNNAIAFNMSVKSATKYGAVYSNLLSSFVSDQSKNASLTEELLKQSAVTASWTGRSMDDVMERIRSGMLGNTESIEDLGINVNVAMIESTEAFKKFANGKSWDQLDFQTQQQIRLFAILEQSTKKYGTEVNKNSGTGIQKLTAKIENLALKIGKVVIPIFNDLLDKYIIPAVDWFTNLSDSVTKSIVTFAGITAAIGPVLLVIGGLISGIAGIVAAIGVIGAPVLLAIAGIVAFGAALVYLYNTNQSVKDAIVNIWNNLKEFFGTVCEVIQGIWITFGDNINYIATNTWDTVVTLIKNTLTIFGNVFGAFSDLLSGNWSELWEHIVNIFKSIGSTIIIIAGNIVTNFLELFQKFSEILVDGVFQKVIKGFEWLVDGVIGIYNKVASVFNKDTVAKVTFDVESPSTKIQGIQDSIDKTLEKVRGGEKTKLPKFSSSPFTDLFKNKKTDTSKTKSSVTDLFNNWKTGANGAADATKNLNDAVKDMVNSIKQQTDSFANFCGLFDKFERKSTSGTRLLTRLKSQVKAMEQWKNALAVLQQKGVSQNLMNDLTKMGPSAVDNVMALSKLSSDQLNQYQGLYDKKFSLASVAAQKLVTSQQSIENYIEKKIEITITNSNIKSDNDVKKIANQIISELKLRGV